MANYPPIIIKNGRLQQLQAVDVLAVPGSLTTAGTINGVNLDSGAWTAYTVTAASQSVGTPAMVATANGAYKQIGRTVHFRVSISITTGGGAGSGVYVSFNLPVVSAVSNSFAFCGVERASTGKALVVNSSGTTGATIRFYDATFPGGVTGYILVVTGTYEAASAGLLRRILIWDSVKPADATLQQTF